MKFVIIAFLCLINSAFAGRFHWNPYAKSGIELKVYLSPQNLTAGSGTAAAAMPSNTQPQRVPYRALDSSRITRNNRVNFLLHHGTFWHQERRGEPFNEVIPIVVGQIGWGFAYYGPHRIGRLLALLLQGPLTIYGQTVDISRDGRSFPRLYGGIWIRRVDFDRLMWALTQRGARLDREDFDFAQNPAQLAYLRLMGRQAAENGHRYSLPVPFNPVTVEASTRDQSDNQVQLSSYTYYPGNPSAEQW